MSEFSIDAFKTIRCPLKAALPQPPFTDPDTTEHLVEEMQLVVYKFGEPSVHWKNEVD
jgi:hypothetical protein